MLTGAFDGPNISQFVYWVNTFLRRQKGMANKNLTVDALTLAYPKSLKHKSFMGINPESLASMAYLKKQLGSKTDVLLQKIEQRHTLDICNSPVFFTNHQTLIDTVRRAKRVYAIERSARTLCILDLLYTPRSIGPKFRFMAGNKRNIWNSQKRCRNVITAVTKRCLQNGVGIETVWDDAESQLWSTLANERITEKERVKVLLTRVFAKQKLLFDYLLCLTLTSMEELCMNHPGVDTILRSSTGKLPVSRLQKLTFACEWSSPLLLELVGVDAEAVMSSTVGDSLVMPRQVSSLPLSIEI
ncbi:Hypothetical protein MVR_LOCUS267 [uncultured virus]|nr:Hypothetical protein MVR_LOCUS267 [uncultured virus]